MQAQSCLSTGGILEIPAGTHPISQKIHIEQDCTITLRANTVGNVTLIGTSGVFKVYGAYSGSGTVYLPC